MDNVSRKILKEVKKSDNHTYMFYVDVEPFADIADECSINAALKYLIANEYLDEVKRKNHVVGVSLAHKALHRKYFTWLAFKNFLIHNIIAIIALIVAVITLCNDLGLIKLPVIM